MNREEGDGAGYESCCDLLGETEKRIGMMEQNNSPQLTAFLTLKQKVISTDKLIREYQAAKVECEILARKNEEFSRLIDQLHRDLSTRNQEYSIILAEVELLKKSKADYAAKFKDLEDEAQKWKIEFEAGNKFTTQLTEKVKQLEKCEEELKDKSKEYDKTESKLELMKGQLKEAKESGNEARKELKKIQKAQAQLVRHALLWGKVAETQGKLPTAQKRFFQKLREDGLADGGENSLEEAEEESKLLEQLLAEGGAEAEPTAPPTEATEEVVYPKGRRRRQSSPAKSKGPPSSAATSSPKAGKGIRAQSKLLEELLGGDDDKVDVSLESAQGDTPSGSDLEVGKMNEERQKSSDKKKTAEEVVSKSSPRLPDRGNTFRSPQTPPRTRSKSRSECSGSPRTVQAPPFFTSPKSSSVHPNGLSSDSDDSSTGPRTRSRSGKAAQSPRNVANGMEPTTADSGGPTPAVKSKRRRGRLSKSAPTSDVDIAISSSDTDAEPARPLEHEDAKTAEAALESKPTPAANPLVSESQMDLGPLPTVDETLVKKEATIGEEELHLPTSPPSMSMFDDSFTSLADHGALVGEAEELQSREEPSKADTEALPAAEGPHSPEVESRGRIAADADDVTKQGQEETVAVETKKDSRPVSATPEEPQPKASSDSAAPDLISKESSLEDPSLVEMEQRKLVGDNQEKVLSPALPSGESEPVKESTTEQDIPAGQQSGKPIELNTATEEMPSLAELADKKEHDGDRNALDVTEPMSDMTVIAQGTDDQDLSSRKPEAEASLKIRTEGKANKHRSVSKYMTPIAFQPAGLLQPTSAVPAATQPPSAFKVPLAPPKKEAPFAAQGIRQSTKDWKDQTVDDEEILDIMEQIRCTIRNIPQPISPLPSSPVPVVKTEPKFTFPTLPRCAFNWAPKKLPIDSQLNEKLGGFHPGITARVRFRRVGAVRDGPRAPDAVCCARKDVVNFAEAERRRKAFVPPPRKPEETFRDRNQCVEPGISRSSAILKKEKEAQSTARPSDRLTGQPANLEERPNLEWSSAGAFSEPLMAPNGQELEAKTSRMSASKNHHDLSIEVDGSKRPKLSQPSVKSKKGGSKKATADLFGDSSSSPESSELSGSSESESESTDEEVALNEPSINSVAGGPPRRPASLLPLKEACEGTTLLPGRVPRATTSSFLPRPAPRKEVSTRLGVKPADAAKKQVPPFPPVVTRTRTLPARSVVPPTSRQVNKEASALESPVSPIKSAPVQLLDEFVPPSDAQFKKRVSHAAKRALETDVSTPVPPSTPKKSRPLTSGLLTPLTPSMPSPSVTCAPTPEEKVATNPSAEEPSMVVPDVLEAPDASYLGILQPLVLSTPGLESLKEETVGNQSEIDDEEPHLAIDAKPSEGTHKDSPRRNGSLAPTEEPEKEVHPASPVDTVPMEENELAGTMIEEDRKEPPQSPLAQDLPASPCGEPTKEMESPLSPDAVGESFHSAVLPIPVESSSKPEESQLSAFELASNLVTMKKSSPPSGKKSKKLRQAINLNVNKYLKAPVITTELLSDTVDRVTRPDSRRDPSIFIRHVMAMVIKDSESELNLSMTPPAPPLTVVQQRCLLLLKSMDEKNREIDLSPGCNPNFFTDSFLSETSSVMFKSDSALTLEQMTALARIYVAIARYRGSLGRARSFLYDCLYFFPPRSYALTYTILSVWAEILRPVSYPLGLSPMDQTISYLLLHCFRVKAVPGLAGKVLQMRSFLQSTLGYKETTISTANDLLTFLMGLLKETKSVDEAWNLSWCLALLARWEGVDLAIALIEQHLWPLLQRWSAGEGTTVGAAAAITCIGMVGKTVPAHKRVGVKKVLEAMKGLLKSEGAANVIQEAAIETVILLGEVDEPLAVVDILKEWIPPSPPSQHLQTVLRAFLERHRKSEAVLVTDT